MHFTITNHQIVSQKQYHTADFQNKMSCHERKLYLNPTYQSNILYLATYQVYPSWQIAVELFLQNDKHRRREKQIWWMCKRSIKTLILQVEVKVTKMKYWTILITMLMSQ